MNHALLGTLMLLVLAGCQESTDRADSGPRETHRLPGWDKTVPGLRIELPPGFQVVTDKGVDFDVHHIFDSTAAGRAKHRRIGIYVGHHPALFAKQERPTKTSTVRGKVANRGVRWVCWKTAARDSICEAQVKRLFARSWDWRPGQLILHLWVATSAEQLAELRRSAGSLQLAQGAHK